MLEHNFVLPFYYSWDPFDPHIWNGKQSHTINTVEQKLVIMMNKNEMLHCRYIHQINWNAKELVDFSLFLRRVVAFHVYFFSSSRSASFFVSCQCLLMLLYAKWWCPDSFRCSELKKMSLFQFGRIHTIFRDMCNQGTVLKVKSLHYTICFSFELLRCVYVPILLQHTRSNESCGICVNVICQTKEQHLNAKYPFICCWNDLNWYYHLVTNNWINWFCHFP